MKRVITITMDIDESTFNAKVSRVVTEDGIEKKEWTPPQGVSTAIALMEMAEQLLEDLNDYMLDTLKKDRPQE